MASKNTFGAAATLRVNNEEFQIFRLDVLEKAATGVKLSRIPYSIKILLENLLRFEDERTVKASDIEYVAAWDPKTAAQEIQFRPARILLQDFTGVPCVVDLAAMRDALKKLGANPELANPLIPADLVIDHSVQVDDYGTHQAFAAKRAARIFAESGAVCVSALGTEGVRQFPRCAARYRHRPPGEPGISGERGVRRTEGRCGASLSRHAHGHRLSHDHD